MQKTIIAAMLTLGMMSPAFAGLMGQTVTTDLQQNGISIATPVTAVVGASSPTGNFFGNQIFDYGDLSFSIYSTNNFCGMYCGGQQIELVLSGLNGVDLTNLMFSTSLNSVQKVIGTNSVTFSWVDQNLPAGNANSPYLSATFGTQSVPEPATLALMGLGLAGLSLSRRRKA